MRSDDSGSSPQRHVYDVDDSEYDDSDDDDDDDESSVSSNISNPVMDSSSESSKVNKGGNTTEEIGEHEQMKQYSAVETARVNRWRILVIISILVAGAAVSTITFLTLSNGQTSDAFDAFELFANTVSDGFKIRVKTIFEANRGLSRDITSSAWEHNETFPYHLVRAFEVKAYDARKEANFDRIIYAPIVSKQSSWINFSISSHSWVEESYTILDQLEPDEKQLSNTKAPELSDVVWSVGDDGELVERNGRGIFAPTFMISPPPIDDGLILENIDLFSIPAYKSVTIAAVKLNDAVFSQFDDNLSTKFLQNNESHYESNELYHTHGMAVQPIFDSLSRETKVVGYIFAIVAWHEFLSNLLPNGVVGIIVVLRNTCDQLVTYELQGNEVVFVGRGDWHDPSYNNHRRTINFTENYFDPDLTNTTEGHCQIFLDVYPSKEYVKPYENSIPAIFTTVIGSLFAVMAIIFSVYNRFVQNRNNKVVDAAARSNAIVSSLFPSNVRDRLLAENQETDGKKSNTRTGKSDRNDVYKSKPIADLFPETTVLFGDIVGFTAWSSVRDPTQVFTLLETVYHAFDQIAHRRKIFKVETIGDCYVAVCGLPEPNKSHAVNMARFAKDCMYKMWALSKKLESTLGPDTGDLTMRMGLHSGPVTAGVLRGERSRFQLFGDTVNTAARMESTGLPDHIQLSQETADLILAAGKTGWIVEREDKVHAKGKGMLQTYFLDIEEKCDTSNKFSNDSTDDETTNNLTTFEETEDFMELAQQADLAKATPLGSSKNLRLVEWNSDILLRHLKQIVSQRVKNNHKRRIPANEDIFLQRNVGRTVIDEVKEIIDLPGCANTATIGDTNDIAIDPIVEKELREYMKGIGGMYQENPFHNFEHASHVTMSVQKLLSRIVAPSDIDRAYQGNTADHTYGITSDPLTQFSCILSALIHDVDHPGVPNATLVTERTMVARRYKNKSVAEQNSVDLAWDLLMEHRFQNLRAAIYGDDDEMHRFRSLIVNSVMATDIVDPEQKAFRNARWEKAFHSNESILEDKHVEINRKATIVIEHLIQASDVSHMMQHWHIYRKWNERFFLECYIAYKRGRAKEDPSLGWYKGEIGFFDFYIIPLAKKLKECGVFGVSCDEYLNYAIKNRQEWEARGLEIVMEMIEIANIQWKEISGGSTRYNNTTTNGSAVNFGRQKSFIVRGYNVANL